MDLYQSQYWKTWMAWNFGIKLNIDLNTGNTIGLKIMLFDDFIMIDIQPYPIKHRKLKNL